MNHLLSEDPQKIFSLLSTGPILSWVSWNQRPQGDMAVIREPDVSPGPAVAWDNPCAEKGKPQGTQTAEAKVDGSLIGSGGVSPELSLVTVVGTGCAALPQPSTVAPLASLVRENSPLSWLAGFLAFPAPLL